nr:ChaN family lipoprotein [Geomonas sp. Red32]
MLNLSACSITKVVRIKDGAVVPVAAMLDDLRDARVVLVGERHNASSHHQLQLEVLKSLQGQGKELAVGMEMFEQASQPALDAWSSGRLPEATMERLFAIDWRNIPYSQYRDILRFARDNRIPVVALNAPRRIVEKVAGSGFASLDSHERSLLPPGTDATVSEGYQAFMATAYPPHGRSGDSFRYLCEAQMLRNRMMARKIEEYLTRRPKAVMVVVAGGGHARIKGGIPEELSGLSYKVLLPPVPSLNRDTVTGEDGDYLLEEPLL